MGHRSHLSAISRRAFLLAPAMLGLGLSHASPRGSLTRQAPLSPALLVRGETLLPGGPMAWRVVRDVAETPPDAAFERRALGFAVATNPFAAILLTDEATGCAFRLDPGGAAFVRDGTFQRRESLGPGTQSYLRIGLVAAAAVHDAGGDRLIFAGPAFAPPSGPVTLTVFRVGIQAGAAFALPRAAAESLVLVEQGELELQRGASDARELLRTVIGSDTSYAVRSVGGAATLHGVREATSVLLAAID